MGYTAQFVLDNETLNEIEQIREILATYQKHGWQLQRVLMIPESRAALVSKEELIFEGARVDDANVDALWFSRPSTGQRQAWELRLVAETPYALFETFEADEPEAAREEVRREMEAKMSEIASKRT